jgi:beta-galactosidase
MKDQFNGLLPQRQPGNLLDALGGRVEQYYALEKDFPASGTWGSGEVKIWAEQLKPSASGAEVLLKYGKSNGWLDNQAAVISRPYGKGRITYIGAILDDKLMATATEWVIQKSGITPAFGPVPDGVQVCRRTGAGKDVFVLINLGQETRRVKLPRSMSLLLSDQNASELELPVYGVEVFTESK